MSCEYMSICPYAPEEALTENQALRSLLRRLSEWDHMQTAGDGPYWLGEIAKVLDGPA